MTITSSLRCLVCGSDRHATDAHEPLCATTPEGLRTLEAVADLRRAARAEAARLGLTITEAAKGSKCHALLVRLIEGD